MTTTSSSGMTSPTPSRSPNRSASGWLAFGCGFGDLESGGWHRATIFRKVRRFRSRYGVHPDEYSFPWITLDLEQAWAADIAGRIRHERGDYPDTPG